MLLVHLTIHILVLVHSNLGERHGKSDFAAEDRKGLKRPKCRLAQRATVGACCEYRRDIIVGVHRSAGVYSQPMMNIKRHTLREEGAEGGFIRMTLLMNSALSFTQHSATSRSPLSSVNFLLDSQDLSARARGKGGREREKKERSV